VNGPRSFYLFFHTFHASDIYANWTGYYGNVCIGRLLACAAVLALAPLGVMQEFMQEATDVTF
jgi:hypothetical protein